MAGSVELGPQIGRIGDLLATPDGRGFYILDFSNSRIAKVREDGTVARLFGQRGDGPGDLRFDFMSSTAPTRLLLVGDALVVFDERSLKAYALDGAVLWDRPVSTFVRANRDGMHLSNAGRGAIRFTESGKYRVNDTTRSVRTSITFRTVDAESFDTDALFRADNNWVLIDSIGAYPTPHPYMSEYRRAWDGDSARVVVYSYKHYGVCFFDAAGQLAAAHRRALAPIPIDRAEEDRALAAGFGTVNHDLPLPFLRSTAREAYAGKWPEHAPLYTDVVLGDNGVALLLRRVSSDRVLVDVFAADRGYVGSFEPPVPELPRRVHDGMAWAVDREELRVLKYTWSELGAAP